MQIEIDGSQGEGGGQILRTALALSTLTQIPFQVKNIRSGRKKPGLKAQHLHAVRALCNLSKNPETDISSAQAEGLKLGASHLSFVPGKIHGRTLSIDIETAGSITLLLQCLLLPCLFAENKVRLKIIGGTDVAWSPSFDYFRNLILPQYRRFADIKIELIRRGFYPKGGGKVDVQIRPKYSLKQAGSFNALLEEIRSEVAQLIITDSSEISEIHGTSIVSTQLQKQEVAERQIRGVKHALASLDVPVRIKSEYTDSKSIGTSITLWALREGNHTVPSIGASALGEKHIRAEEVGKLAAINLLNELSSGNAVDHYLADNLVPLIALSGGKIVASHVSSHTQTNIDIVRKFLNTNFVVRESEISC